jgi:L-xylulokinase
MSNYILGIDSGLTVTKALLFDESGRVVSLGRREIEVLKPRERFVERDMEAHWRGTCEAIREAVAAAGIDPARIVSVGATGHGDGVYLIDADGAPLGRAILSLDSRGASVMAMWREAGVLDEALRVTGQMPYAPAPATLLRWIRDHEPERYGRIRWVLSCKDWLRYRLTGSVATDLTESSVSFVDPATQDYSLDALDLFGVGALRGALPPVLGSCEIAGVVSGAAAKATGLREGTPVAAGLHDVTASAVGSGVVEKGELSLVAGTFSVNQVLSLESHPSRHWFSRNGFKRGQWMNMTLSPASSANIDWYVKQHCRDALDKAAQRGNSPFDHLEGELIEAFASDSAIIYHPFLYGSPHGDDASAAFLGVQGWHHRGHLLRALLEGVVFNHRHHVDDLRTEFQFNAARLTGGSSRSPRVCQMFADVLDLTVSVVDVDETGAFGAALCGAVGVGLFDSLSQAVKKAVSVRATYRSRPEIRADMDARYERYQQSVRHLAPLWRMLRHTQKENES